MAKEPPGKTESLRSATGEPTGVRGTGVQALSGLDSAQKAEARQQTGRRERLSAAAPTRTAARLTGHATLRVQPARSNTKGVWVSAGSAMKTDVASYAIS